jgi:3-oxoacyl-[acyl-carrier-protein] synthase III
MSEFVGDERRRRWRRDDGGGASCALPAAEKAKARAQIDTPVKRLD